MGIMDSVKDSFTKDKNMDPHHKSATNRYRNSIELFIIVGTAILVALIVRTFFLQLFYIPTTSMVPTLKVNDKIFVNKIAYKFNDVDRGDIIVFDSPDMIRDQNPKIRDLIKRVIGLPGETVEGKCPQGESFCEVDIYVNGKKLNEPYLVPGLQYRPFPAETVPANSVFVMGDNRDNSEDGRVFGPIPKDDIVGRAFFRLWPANSFGFL